MVPTLHDGDSALMDETRRRSRSGQIYALRTAEGLLVKRLRKREGQWWADSDNPVYDSRALEGGRRDSRLGGVVGAHGAAVGALKIGRAFGHAGRSMRPML